MLRRDLLKALAAFVTAAPAVAAAATPSGVRSEPAFSSAGKPASSAKSPPAAFTPPTAPAEPEPAVFGLDLLPAIDASKVTPQMQALREALWDGDQLPVEVDVRGNSTRIVFFCPESARRLGTDEHKQALARHAIATMTPSYARIYNGGVACEVTFRRTEA